VPTERPGYRDAVRSATAREHRDAIHPDPPGTPRRHGAANGNERPACSPRRLCLDPRSGPRAGDGGAGQGPSGARPPDAIRSLTAREGCDALRPRSAPSATGLLAGGQPAKIFHEPHDVANSLCYDIATREVVMLRDTFYSIERLAELREERLQRFLRKPRPGPAESRPPRRALTAISVALRIGQRRRTSTRLPKSRFAPSAATRDDALRRK
jgi:hypothetical protein